MPPGFPCAELLPCDVLHALYGSAAQDLMGYLKQSHMEYQKLFTVQTTTLRLKTVTLVIDHISVLPFIFTVYSLRGVVVSTCLRARQSWGPSPVATGLSWSHPPLKANRLGCSTAAARPKLQRLPLSLHLSKFPSTILYNDNKASSSSSSSYHCYSTDGLKQEMALVSEVLSVSHWMYC